jgi:signal transduction histidine kinase
MNELVENLERQIDSKYQDAVISNYSHEQLTPLNSILNNSLLLVDHLDQIRKYFNE